MNEYSIDDIINKYSKSEESLIEILQDIQNKYNYLPAETFSKISSVITSKFQVDFILGFTEAVTRVTSLLPMVLFQPKISVKELASRASNPSERSKSIFSTFAKMIKLFFGTLQFQMC